MLRSEIIQTPHGFFLKDVGEVQINKALSATKLITLKQVHSNIAHTISGDESNLEGDALVTNKPNIAIGIYTADCGPILFSDNENKVIAAAHAGWKGARHGIIESTVNAMKKLGAKNISASLGPCIHQKSYEVSNDFIKSFLEESQYNEKFFKEGVRQGHLQFDLPGYIRQKLKQAEIKAIDILDEDTLSQPQKFCSYRRGTLAGVKEVGRQISAICLR